MTEQATERVVGLWREALGDDGLTAESALPDLALQSVKIVELSLRLYQELGVAVPIEAFFEAGTVGEFGATVVRLRTAAATE
jgi:acyl carrier protein